MFVGNIVSSLRLKLSRSILSTRNSSIGEGTYLGRGVVVGDSVKVGKNCYIGDLCVLSGGIIIGDNTRIEPQCHITRHSRIGKYVFIAPFFLSTNDNKLNYDRKGHGENLNGVTIDDYARVAGHVMTLPGIRIGQGAIIGSFSLVTKDVAPYSFVYGIPARQHEDKGGLLKGNIDPRFMM